MDLDGTFIDSMGFWENLVFDFLGDYGLKKEDIGEIDLFGVTLEESPKILIDTYNLDISYEEGKKDIYNRITHHYKTVEPKAGALEYVKRAFKSGKKIAVATATSHDGAELILKRFEIDHLVDVLITEETSGYRKTEDQFFLELSNILDVGLKDMVIFEDDHSVIEKCNELGLFTVGIIDKVYPDEIIEKIKDISDISVNDFTELEVI